MWDKIKAVDPVFADLTADVTVDASLPVPPTIYQVVAGDTLSKIANKLYGDATKYMKIFEANKDQLKECRRGPETAESRVAGGGSGQRGDSGRQPEHLARLLPHSPAERRVGRQRLAERRDHLPQLACQAGVASCCGKQRPSNSSTIATDVDAPGDAPSSADSVPSAELTTSVPNCR